MTRVLISGLVAVCFVSSLSATADARGGFAMGGGFARGGLAIGRPLVFPGGALHRAAPRPMAPLGLTRRPLTPFHSATSVLALHRTFPRVRRFYGRDLPGNGVGVYYGSDGFADIGDGVVPASAPMSANGVVVESPRRGCGTQTVVVPAEAGGEARITMTYC